MVLQLAQMRIYARCAGADRCRSPTLGSLLDLPSVMGAMAGQPQSGTYGGSPQGHNLSVAWVGVPFLGGAATAGSDRRHAGRVCGQFHLGGADIHISVRPFLSRARRVDVHKTRVCQPLSLLGVDLSGDCPNLGVSVLNSYQILLESDAV